MDQDGALAPRPGAVLRWRVKNDSAPCLNGERMGLSVATYAVSVVDF